MKKQLLSCICSGLFSILFVNISFAQEETFKELPPVTVSASTPHATVTAKVNKAFERTFKNSSQQKWFRIHEKFLVKFIQNDQENSALFTKNGTLVYHICYGMEKNLPADVRSLVKSKYYDQTIMRIYKVSQNDRVIWVIGLEDAKDCVMVRVEDMEMEETLRLNKSI